MLGVFLSYLTRVFYSKDSVMGDIVRADLFRNLLGETWCLVLESLTTVICC